MDDEAVLNQLTGLYEKQKQLAKSASDRKGQRPRQKATRAELCDQFSTHAAAQVPSLYSMVRQTAIGYAYPPCSIPLANLEPIAINELELETVHRGRVLVVRTFGYPSRIQAVQNAIEDRELSVDRLAVYNFDMQLRPEQLLPKGQLLAVKEPYYKVTADGAPVVRVDHPSDLVVLRPEDAIIPMQLRPKLLELVDSLSHWKAKGNAAFKAKDYRGAIEMYSKGIDYQQMGPECHQPKEEGTLMLRLDMYRNRAQANIYLGRYEAALADAEASFIITNAWTQAEASHVNSKIKAFYRAGIAAYHLQNYTKAEEKFEAILEMVPSDADAQREIQRIRRRLVEQSLGAYDFAEMIDNAMMTNKRLDVADFTANVIVQKTADRGHGLFTTKTIKAGELVLVEKALFVAFNTDEGTDQSVIMNLNTDVMSVGTHSTRLIGVVHKLLHSPKLAEEFIRLYDGGYKPRGVKIVDGVVAVDTFQVEAALDYNGFGLPADPTAVDRDMADQPTSSTGVWLTSSFINHDCIGNAARSFIGDIMVIRATKDLNKGDEILMRYKNSEDDIESFQKSMLSAWKFKCSCALCVAEAKTPEPQRQRRLQLIKDARTFLETNQITEQQPPPLGLIAKAEQLRAKIEASYGQAQFKDLPRQGLHDLSLWICMTHILGAQHKVQTAAVAVLRDLGFMVSVKKNKVSIERTHCRMDMSGVHAGMYLAVAYYRKGQNEVGEELERFTMEMYKTIHGCMLRFEEKFGVIKG
ncbi:hypothetical protein M409DRAFT_26311 [Zasmidium cellare ATCC 36951]|uniref:SET domain-containing protein n=1 Tax=Zasmidium cellare ATCC 36951 TaxID=1080233 RepID=A0A6A6C7V6_ZASCE|nr:uncharacterized protein M409DRAFT_26311 [Zasmidium cellare ATCC 36951]KAF2163267.1 hypothetical protein M409DRAFT_26311 [Zasmidium cellare ATCC 36951]